MGDGKKRQDKPAPQHAHPALLAVVAVSSSIVAIVLQQRDVALPIVATLAVLTCASGAVAVWRFVQRALDREGGHDPARVLGVACVGGFLALSLSLTSSLLVIASGSDDCARYRRIATGAGIPGRTALTELSNSELQQRALAIVSKLRDRAQHYDSAVGTVLARERGGEVTSVQAHEQINGIRAQCGREYTDSIRSDMEVTLWELRNRIPERQWKQVVALPHVNPIDPGGQTLDLGLVLPPEFCLSIMPMRAQELERLAKLLPD